MLDLVAGWETICYNNIFANDIFANSLISLMRNRVQSGFACFLHKQISLYKDDSKLLVDA